MSERLTDDEIKALRVQVLGYHSLRDVLRALDEIEERRRADARWAETLDALDAQQRGPYIIDEAAEPMTAEQWAKFQALMPKRKDGGA